MSVPHVDTDGDRATSDDRRARLAQRSVLAVFFTHGLLFASWTAHIPQVKTHLGLDDGTLGLALLGTPLGCVCAMGAAASLAPRIGSRRLVQICLAGYCLSGPLVGLAGSFPTLFAALFVWGAFQGTLDIAMNTQAIAVEHLRGRTLMNGMHAGWGIGAFVGAGLGTLGVAIGLSLTRQLVILGVPVLIVAGASTLQMLHDSVASHDEHGVRRKTRIRPTVAMAVLGAIAFASMLCEGAASDWSSVYLRESLGGSAVIGGLGYTSFTAAMVVVRLFGDRLLLLRPPHVLLPLLSAAAAILFAAALLIAAVPIGLLGLFALGLGLGVVVPTAFSAAGRLPAAHPGVGVAVVSALGWAGFVCGPPLIGQLAAATSLPVALGVVPALVAFIAVATSRARALRAGSGDGQ